MNSKTLSISNKSRFTRSSSTSQFIYQEIPIKIEKRKRVNKRESIKNSNNNKLKEDIIKGNNDSFKGREIVFVDPLDECVKVWWPAMIVPKDEVDSSMNCSDVKSDECVVKYFEDRKYSIVPFQDLKHFKLGDEPYTTFEKIKDVNSDKGIKAALIYLQKGDLCKGFIWKLWFTSQLDCANYHLPINIFNSNFIKDEENEAINNVKTYIDLNSNMDQLGLTLKLLRERYLKYKYEIEKINRELIIKYPNEIKRTSRIKSKRNI